jgi:hypothetical protein
MARPWSILRAGRSLSINVGFEVRHGRHGYNALSRVNCRPQRAHYLRGYGRERPAETLICTAVSARFLVRMGSPNRRYLQSYQAALDAHILANPPLQPWPQPVPP